MATFYGGEQLSEMVVVSGTINDVDGGEYFAVYMIPNGFYGKLKFSFIGPNSPSSPDVYYVGSTQSFISYAPKGATPSTGNPYTASFLTGLPTGNFAEVKYRYGVNSTSSAEGVPTSFYDMYLESESRFFVSTINQNQNLKYEIHIELYKKP